MLLTGGASRVLGILVVAGLLLASGCAASAPEAASSEPMDGAELLEALRGGGYVVFLRHAASDNSVDQGAPPEVTDCARQRNLTSQGRRDAEHIGEAIDTLDIPVGDVLASPYCRTTDTAELAFGEAEEEARLLNGNDEAAAGDLRALLSEPPSRGNTWLVGHVSNLGAAADLSVAEGEAAVFAPVEDDTGFALVAKIPVDGWDALDEAP